MTNSEFSDLFSTMLDSYGTIGNFGDQASHQEIVLDEYEKSLFLTQAQDIVVKSYFDKVYNAEGQGIDDSARRQADFSSLVKVAVCTPAGASTKFDSRGIIYKLPSRSTGSYTTITNPPSVTDVLMILNEKYTVGTTEYVVKPISAQEYDRQMSKAYSKPLKKQAWRIFNNAATGFDINTEIIPRTTGSGTYTIRYVQRPLPIILEDLTGTGLSVDGIVSECPCQLNPILHIDILNKAVELAVATHRRTVPSGTQAQNR